MINVHHPLQGILKPRTVRDLTAGLHNKKKNVRAPSNICDEFVNVVNKLKGTHDEFVNVINKLKGTKKKFSKKNYYHLRR